MLATQEINPQHVKANTAMQSSGDISLLKAVVQRRDREAFAELVERYNERAYNLAYRILGNATLAEDAVQDAMLSIWTSTTTLPHDDVQGWILRIVVNRSRFLRRTTIRRQDREKSASNQPSQPEQPVSEAADRNEVLSALRTHMQQLPEIEMQLLTYCYGANMSHRKIGEMLNMPNRTVTFKIQQALDRLRNNLSGAGLAVVTPLLAADSLSTTLTTGIPAPHGLTAKVLSLIDTAGSSGKPRLRRRRLSSVHAERTPIVLVAAAAAVVVAAALIWSSAAKPKPLAQTQASVPAIPAASVEAPAPAPNLIQDPGFELQSSARLNAPWSAEGPAMSGADDARRMRRSHSGEKDGFLEGYFGKGIQGWSAILQTVTVKPETRYTFSIWVNNSNSACFTNGQFGVRTLTGTVVAQAPIPLSEDYIQLHLEFDSSNNTALVFFAGYVHAATEVLKRPDGQSNSFLHLDDVSLFETKGGAASRP